MLGEQQDLLCWRMIEDMEAEGDRRYRGIGRDLYVSNLGRYRNKTFDH